MDRWEFLMAGQALVQMSQAEEQSQAGELVLSRAAWGHVASRCEAEMGRRKFGVKRVLQVKNPVQPIISEWRWAKWTQVQCQTRDAPILDADADTGTSTGTSTATTGTSCRGGADDSNDVNNALVSPTPLEHVVRSLVR